jgi:hypothetical protein
MLTEIKDIIDFLKDVNSDENKAAKNKRLEELTVEGLRMWGWGIGLNSHFEDCPRCFSQKIDVNVNSTGILGIYGQIVGQRKNALTICQKKYILFLTRRGDIYGTKY